MSDEYKLLDQIEEWERLASLTNDTEIFNQCAHHRLQLLIELEKVRSKHLKRTVKTS